MGAVHRTRWTIIHFFFIEIILLVYYRNNIMRPYNYYYEYYITVMTCYLDRNVNFQRLRPTG